MKWSSFNPRLAAKLPDFLHELFYFYQYFNQIDWMQCALPGLFEGYETYF